MVFKMVPVENVDKAMVIGMELVEQLKKVRSGKIVNRERCNDVESICECLADMIESGNNFQQLVRKIDSMILKVLVNRGHDTSEKLAEVIKTTPGNMRQLLHTRGLKMVEIRK